MYLRVPGATSIGRVSAEWELRAITRHLAALTQQRTRQMNRLHAAAASQTGSRCVQQDLKRSLRELDRRMEKMRRHALAVIQQDAELRSRFALLLSIPGVGEISALNLLGELALLAPGLTVRQWVAHSGLDPAHHQSGTSVLGRSRISRAGNRYLRRALYMPALVAVRRDPCLRAFYQALAARHKAKLQALIAVARKMLHAIFGMFRKGTIYDGSRLFPTLELASAT